MRRRGTTFAAPTLVFPPTLAGCGERDAESGVVRMFDDWRGAAIDEAFVYLQARKCTALVRVRRSDLCVSPIEYDGVAQPPERERRVMG